MAERVENYDLIRLYSLGAPKRLQRALEYTQAHTYI